jgi:hypothetical protein
MTRAIAALLLAFGIACHAHAAEEYQRYALTVPMLEKHRAATKEFEKTVKKKDDDDGDKDGLTVDQLAKQIDATPGARPILAKHGFSSRDYALVSVAFFQAGFYLMMEPSMDKKKGAQLLASYPAETRANIELLRKNPQLMKQ